MDARRENRLYVGPSTETLADPDIPMPLVAPYRRRLFEVVLMHRLSEAISRAFRRSRCVVMAGSPPSGRN